MQSQYYYLANSVQMQVVFSKILTKTTTLYKRFVPNDVRNRRNVHLKKSLDVVIIASSIYRTICHNLFLENFPERSRFCRICQNLTQSIQRMRYFMILDLCQICFFGVFDSFPFTLCHTIRNLRGNNFIRCREHWLQRDKENVLLRFKILCSRQ